MFWVVSYTMAQPACETVMNWLSSGGVTELLPEANVQPNERFMVMREVSPLPISLLSGFSMNLYLKLVFQMEESLFAGQVVPSIAMVETYTRLLLIAPHSLICSHFSHLAQRNASLLSKPAVTLLVLEIVNYRLLPPYSFRLSFLIPEDFCALCFILLLLYISLIIFQLQISLIFPRSVPCPILH
ncbi:mediator of RNA polymerase II transcription subunit 23-like [Gossypium hirsutum]|uniref:Mediator of RNA polymerase II transcription subunit 23-like n=1 Tax=Gossypium hirsutum TaxID=3635 RepID=A0A1U8ICW0_GOSHI|nr:mediator of RNA polymerase II transcription subunit 23-like [Gossypium hirsutum]